MELEVGEIVQVANFLICPEEFPLLCKDDAYFVKAKKKDSMGMVPISIPTVFDGLKLIYLGEPCVYEDFVTLRIFKQTIKNSVFHKYTIPSFLLIRGCGRVLDISTLSLEHKQFLFCATKRVTFDVIKRKCKNTYRILEEDKNFVVKNEALNFTEGLTVGETLYQLVHWSNTVPFVFCPACNNEMSPERIRSHHYIGPDNKNLLLNCHYCKAVLLIFSEPHQEREPFKISLMQVPIPDVPNPSPLPF